MALNRQPLQGLRPLRGLGRFTLLLCGLVSFASQAADCIPSPYTGPGGNYATPKRQGGNLGKGLHIKGLVVSAGTCRPVAGAVIETWQAGHDGQYSDRLRTSLNADRRGRFEIRTEWPNFEPPHIHFHVAAPGFQRLLTIVHLDKKTDVVEVRLVLAKLPAKR